MIEASMFDLSAIHKQSVYAVQIRNCEHQSVAADHTVSSRHGWTRKHNVVFRTPPHERYSFYQMHSRDVCRIMCESQHGLALGNFARPARLSGADN